MKRRTVKKILMQELAGILAFMILFVFTGCGGEPEGQEKSSTETGRIALSIAWKTQSAESSDIQNPDGTLNCENSQVAFIYAAVYDSENRLLGDSGSEGWDCNMHSGVIEGIEAGEGRKLVILAKNQSGDIVFRGEQKNITVSAGQTVKPAPVEAYTFSTELMHPEHEEVVTNGAFTLQWSALPGDINYHILVSVNSDLRDPVIDKLTTATELSPEGLSSDVLYYWRVDAIDNFGNIGKSALFSFKIESNLPPVLDPIGNKQVLEDETLTFTLQAIDPEGKNLTYSAGNLPTGATFNSTSGQFIWTPDFYQGGKSYQDILFYVLDDTNQRDEETITITVGDDGINHPPELNPIGNKGVGENNELRFTISAVDPDDNNDDNLIYSAGNLPNGAIFNANTHEFRWTPNYVQSGVYQNIVFQVTENGIAPLSDAESITISVGNVNRPPALNAIGDQSVNENEQLTFTITASDPDGNDIQYTAESNGPSALPAGWDFNTNTRIFSWTPGFEDTGNYMVTFSAIDDGSPNLNDFEEIWISVGDVNRPPNLDLIGNKSGVEGEELTFAVTATDSDGDTLTLSAESIGDTGLNQPIPTGWSFNSDTQVFSWIPTYDEAGVYDLKFIAVDNGIPNLNDEETIVITITNTNRDPVLTPIGNQVVNEGSPLLFTISGSDPDTDDTLTYSAQSIGADALPIGWSFIAGDTFSWTPKYNEAGDYDITFTVIDDGLPINLSASETITITVTDINGPPVLASIGNKSVSEGSLLQFSISATDPDLGDVLVFSADNLPGNAVFNETTHEFTWTPGYDDAGDYSVTFAVTDDGFPVADASETITISVSNVNRSPILDLIGNQTVNEGSTLDFTATANDPDGDGYTFSLSNAPLGALIDPDTGEFTWTPLSNQSGDHIVTFVVTDDGDPSENDSETITITVNDTL